MHIVNPHLPHCFAWLVFACLPVQGGTEVVLGHGCLPQSVGFSWIHRSLSCLEFFFDYTLENESCPDSFKHTCTFLLENAGMPGREQQSRCMTKLGTDMSDFSFHTDTWRGSIAARLWQEATLRARTIISKERAEGCATEVWKWVGATCSGTGAEPGSASRPAPCRGEPGMPPWDK